MSVPAQLKRTSSICARIEEERGVLQPTASNSPEVESSAVVTESVVKEQEKVKYDAGQEDDTDVVSDSDTVETEPDIQHAQDNEGQIQRMSSRIMSMTRRGRINLERYKSVKFLYFANDYLAVRGDGKDFYLCRVLEDVPENKGSFNIAWLDRVDTEKQHYEASFDDICYQNSVIDRVKVDQVQDGLFLLPPKYFKGVKKLLKEVLQMERGDDISQESSDNETNDSISESEDDGEKDDDAPPKKKRKTVTGSVKEKNHAARKEKKSKKAEKPTKRRGLVPNDAIKVVDKDPLFEERNDLPVAHVKRGIRGVLLNDMQMLKDAILDVENVFTVFWKRSVDIKLGPVHYALLNENKEAISVLFSKENSGKRKARFPNASISRMSTGRYNFYTFGHAVRPIEASRGAKEGNNAFLKSEGDQYPNSDIPFDFCFKYNLSPEIITHYWKINKDNDVIIDYVDVAIRNGHRKLAAYFVAKELEKGQSYYGFNFLHKEVLANDNEPLSKFKSQSVTKKAYRWNILPLHCAAINPNPKYLQELFFVVPDYQVKDSKGRKLIHYAAACEGPGPLKFLLSRGADPNDVDNKGTTPLMIAAKLGRDENIVELATVTVAVDDIDAEDADDEMEDEERPAKPEAIKRVNVNAKHRKTSKAPLHYAAKNGHESTVALLVQHGAKIDLQAGAGKNNFTALLFAAEQGHLNVVKKLVELGASPDIKARHRKTPLMIAAQNGNYPVMSYLLRIGVNPNAQDSSLNTPIHYAAAYGWYHCMKLLLEAGADPNTANNWKTTPLSIALLKDNLDCAELLHKADVDIDFPDDKGSTVLMNQLLSNYDESNLENVRFLVEKKGANVNIKDMNGSTALHYLALNSVYQTQLSLKKTNRNKVHFSKPSSDICLKMASMLIDAGADVNALQDGHTPLLVALLQNNFPLVELLLENGTDLNIKVENKELKPAFHVLLSKSEPLDLIELFEKSTDYEKYDDMTSNDLKMLYRQHKDEIEKKLFQLFIKYGADVNAINANGQTALMITISNGSAEMTEQLLSFGSSPLLGNDEFNHNILHHMALACTKVDLSKILSSIAGKFDLSSLVNQVDNDGFTPLLLACETVAQCKSDKVAIERCERFLKVLIKECNADVNLHVAEKKRFGKDEEGKKHRSVPDFGLVVEKEKQVKDDPFGLTGKFTCFHFLAMLDTQPDGSVGLINMLANHANADLINAKCRHGRTALHQAIISKNHYAALALIKAGIDVNLPSFNSEYDDLLDPLSLASRSTFQFDIVRDLIKANANPNFKNHKDGKVALSFGCMNIPDAVSLGYSVLDLVKELIAADAEVNLVDQNNRTPLHYLINASSGGYEVLTEVEEFLLLNGADPCAVDCDGRMPLFYSFYKLKQFDTSLLDPISAVRLLCNHTEKSGKLQTMMAHKDKMERTMLHYAALRGSLICSSFLLKRGASVTEIDKEGNSPVSLALRSGHHGCALLMLQHNSKLPSWEVVTPVTEDQLLEYKKKEDENKWKSNRNHEIGKPPQTITKTAFQLAIEKDWPGVAYSILEDGEIPLIEAFKAALKASKLSLALNLLRQRSAFGDFNSIDDNKCNMLHLVAAHANKDLDAHGKIVQIAEFLTSKKVAASAADVDGILPIHLAANHAHFALCKFLLESYPESIDIANNDDITPLAAVYAAVTNESCQFEDRHIQVIKHFMNQGVSTLNVCYYTGTKLSDGGPESTTILNDMVLLENDGNFSDEPSKDKIGCIEYLLNNGADINFTNHEGITPLMVAVDSNSPEMVKLLLKYKNIKLDVKSKDGDSLMHRCVGSKEEFYQEKKEIFEILRKKRVSLEELDSKGHPPLYYAMKQSSGGIASLFPNRMKKDMMPEIEDPEHVFPFETNMDQYWNAGELDVEKDAKEEMKGLKDIPMRDNTPPVDNALNMKDNGVVHADEDTGLYYDVVLSKVDVRWGLFGLNVFYKLQVVYHKGKQLWILFNRWGRVGDSGQHQQTPFNTAHEACNEFKKIFKSKTGNKWEEVESFKKMPKKYAIVKNETNPERMLHRENEILKPFNLEECPKSNLPEELKDFMAKITSLDVFEDCIISSCRFDSSYTPFGLISREKIEEAKVLVGKIKDILPAPGSETVDENVYEQIAELSNNVFMLVPPANYAFEKIRPLNSENEISQILEGLEELTQLSVASQVLLAAQRNKQDINPLDYCFRALNIRFEIIDHTSTECQYIMEYLENAFKHGEPPMIAGIFRVNRESENSNFDDCGIKHNRQLLWHGTHSAHMISILKHGFQVNARNSRRIGRSLGDGIYFSESFEKSKDYCDNNGFVFLCEVAMGDSSENREDPAEGNAVFHSIVVTPSDIPDPKMDYFTPYGAKLPKGPLIRNEAMKEYSSWWTVHHECVVFDVRQIKMRYLVITK